MRRRRAKEEKGRELTRIMSNFPSRRPDRRRGKTRQQRVHSSLRREVLCPPPPSLYPVTREDNAENRCVPCRETMLHAAPLSPPSHLFVF